ncbi:MAG TPA: glycosyltransferase [Vicinamibacterales bacterium]|jgi:glycosyltransferase involved in cell wall biosynthesis|nr:glycosyltransferase [Vicinamibacterales bacterium]
MHILMIAPEPFFEPRGTPFSEFHRIKALIALGHTVDLVTYPFGRDVEMPGLRVVRCLRPPLVRQVRIGPSWAKVPLDAALAATALRRALSTAYDAVHSHEEGGLIGVALAAMLGVPHLYDMHSSLPQQLSNFDFSSSRPLVWGMGQIERLLVRRSRVVIVICQQLVEVVRAIDPLVPTVLIENAPGSGDLPVAGASTSLRAAWGIEPDVPVVLYTGTFEAYQGLDLLYAAAARVRVARPDVRFLLVGGQPDQVEAARRQARSAGADGVVLFTGQRPSEEIPQFLDAATVLASPRSRGTNTPLKIYQYLRAGRPIIATRLLTHTQVLDDSVAVLTEATPEAYAAGILRAVDDPAEADAIGRRARALADTKYSYEAYLERTRHAYAELFGSGAAQVARGVA